MLVYIRCENDDLVMNNIRKKLCATYGDIQDILSRICRVCTHHTLGRDMYVNRYNITYDTSRTSTLI